MTTDFETRIDHKKIVVTLLIARCSQNATFSEMLEDGQMDTLPILIPIYNPL